MAILSSFGAPPVPAGAAEGAPATIVFHEDLVIGLDPAAPIGHVNDIAVDSSGVIYVLDTGFMTIHKFDPDGAHLADFGREGEAPGEFFEPAYMALGPQGDLYLAEGRTNITVIHPDGTPGPKFRRHVPAIPRSICVDRTGRIIVSSFDEANQTVIQRYGAGDFAFEDSFGDSYAAGSGTPAMLEQTYAGGLLDVAPDGSIVFAQLVPQVLRIFTPEGKLLQTIPARSGESPVPEPNMTRDRVFLPIPIMTTSLVAMDDGTCLTALWFPETEGHESHTVLDVYDRTGRRLATSVEPGGFAPRCRDRQGRLYVGRVRSISETEELIVVVRYRMEIVPPER